MNSKTPLVTDEEITEVNYRRNPVNLEEQDKWDEGCKWLRSLYEERMKEHVMKFAEWKDKQKKYNLDEYESFQYAEFYAKFLESLTPKD